MSEIVYHSYLHSTAHTTGLSQSDRTVGPRVSKIERFHCTTQYSTHYRTESVSLPVDGLKVCPLPEVYRAKDLATLSRDIHT